MMKFVAEMASKVRIGFIITKKSELTCWGQIWLMYKYRMRKFYKEETCAIEREKLE